jgi:sarcosine oxidase subunit gamma
MAEAWLRILPPSSRFILHGDAAARAAASTAWGVAFTETSCRALGNADRATLWLGPDEYLLWQLGRNASDERLAAIETALHGIPHALVDISHRQIALEVGGRYAESILSGGCPLDLSLREFPVGMCTRTVFAKADIVLWRTSEREFHLEVWRSFEAYVGAMLREIGQEFAGAA